MKIFLCIIFLVFSGCAQAAVENMELSGSKVTLPEGNVLGVAMHEQKDMFFVQQLVLSTGEGGVILSSRQLSAWSLKTRLMLTRRVLDPAPRHLDTYPCGRVEVSTRMNRILFCSSETYLEVLDPDTLSTVGKVGLRNDQYIYDFAIDDQHDRVFVLSMRGDDSPRLTTYSLHDGSQQQETVLPPNKERKMMLAVLSKSGHVAIAADQYVHGGEKSDIFFCSSEGALRCSRVAQIDGVSQISSLPTELLAATRTFADRKKECLISVELNTHSVSRKYCAPGTGIHYAVGVADDRYVVAFTGIGKRLWWKEQNVVVENSFSVWMAGNGQIAAVAKDPTNFGNVQSVVQVFASRTQPVFIVYVGESNLLYLYSINDLN